MLRRPPRSTQSRSSAASDVYKRQTPKPQNPLLVAFSRDSKIKSYLTSSHKTNNTMDPKNDGDLAKELVDTNFERTEEENKLLVDPVVIPMPETKSAQESEAPEQPPSPSFWQLEYYREYFDISTESVVRRIKKAMWPFERESFVETEEKSDLYVPLWTFITLVITMSTFGSIVAGVKKASEEKAGALKIVLDPSRIIATTFILSFYLVVNPCLFFGLLKYRGSKVRIGQILCLYGYSYLPFIPMSFLYGIQMPVFQVVVLFGAAIFSTYFLYRNLSELCQNYLQNWMNVLNSYMVIVQVLLVILIYFTIYN
eukprot:TRINITY_DN549_c0_g1_i12.p1 TRINITY_DN549_c0_g1~~TRINITY_DN549_c0_g1_i12.p1  ORF type:complete len:325 (+),score=54.62 TRINITY_DN549_c0_g1_i12:42-977(+)